MAMYAENSHVDRDDKDYRLGEQNSEWAGDILDRELLQVDFDFFLLSVDTLESKRVKGKQMSLVAITWRPRQGAVIPSKPSVSFFSLLTQLRVSRRNSEALLTSITGPYVSCWKNMHSTIAA